MQTISDYSEKFDVMVNQYLEPAVTHKYVLPILALILILYVSHVRPTLPNFVVELFHNNIFRLVVCTYIVYRANHDPQSAVLIAAVFLIIMHMVNKQYIDKFSNTSNITKCQDAIGKLPNNNKPTELENLKKTCANLEKKYTEAQKNENLFTKAENCYKNDIVKQGVNIADSFIGDYNNYLNQEQKGKGKLRLTSNQLSTPKRCLIKN